MRPGEHGHYVLADDDGLSVRGIERRRFFVHNDLHWLQAAHEEERRQQDVRLRAPRCVHDGDTRGPLGKGRPSRVELGEAAFVGCCDRAVARFGVLVRLERVGEFVAEDGHDPLAQGRSLVFVRQLEQRGKIVSIAAFSEKSTIATHEDKLVDGMRVRTSSR